MTEHPVLTATEEVPAEATVARGRSAGPEAVLRCVLRIPDQRPAATRSQAEGLFSVSILLSAARCLLTYVAIPLLGPVLGSSLSHNLAVDIPVGVLALVFDVKALRRFWLANHPWRWWMTAVYVVLAGMVAGLLIADLVAL